MVATSDPGRFEETLGYSFVDRRLLERALTHASAVAEGGGYDPGSTYQRLEFLGDRVLGLVVADMLIASFPDAVEGDLNKRLARLVSGNTCADVALEMGLDRFVRIGGSLAGLPSGRLSGVLGDVCESVIGALYRDGGLDAARAVIERYWRNRITAMDGPPRDAKTALQEWAHANALPTPTYSEISRQGPDHAPRFNVAVQIGAETAAIGEGPNKREAEQAAAEEALRHRGVVLLK